MLNKPNWLKQLFRLFAITYKNLWSDVLYSEQLEEANAVIWMKVLENFPEEIIMKAGLESIKHYHFPPSPQQFLELANATLRHKTLEDVSKQIEHHPYRKDAPCPLLTEWLAKHPINSNERIRNLYQEFRHDPNKLGQVMMEEIKNNCI